MKVTSTMIQCDGFPFFVVFDACSDCNDDSRATQTFHYTMANKYHPNLSFGVALGVRYHQLLLATIRVIKLALAIG